VPVFISIITSFCERGGDVVSEAEIMVVAAAAHM
jgi:hypothetical protein